MPSSVRVTQVCKREETTENHHQNRLHRHEMILTGAAGPDKLAPAGCGRGLRPVSGVERKRGLRKLPSSVEEGCPKGGVVLSKPLLDLWTSTTPSAPASEAFGGIFFLAQPPLLS